MGLYLCKGWSWLVRIRVVSDTYNILLFVRRKYSNVGISTCDVSEMSSESVSSGCYLGNGSSSSCIRSIKVSTVSLLMMLSPMLLGLQL